MSGAVMTDDPAGAGTPPPSLAIARFCDFIDLGPTESSLIDDLTDANRTIRRGAIIRGAGAPVAHVFLLKEGWVTSSITLPNGARQIVRVHLPGDILGTPSMASPRAAETLIAVTAAVIAPISLIAIRRLFTGAPRLGMALFLEAQQERILLMDRVTSLGRTSAAQALGAFLLYVHDRLDAIGQVHDGSFVLPLTLEQIADVLGVTPTHVHRTFRELKDRDLVLRSGSEMTLVDPDRMRQFAAIPTRNWVRNPVWLGQE